MSEDIIYRVSSKPDGLLKAIPDKNILTCLTVEQRTPEELIKSLLYAIKSNLEDDQLPIKVKVIWHDKTPTKIYTIEPSNS